MTSVKASFVDGVRVPIGGGTITYTPTGLRATVADPAKTVAPIDIVAEITAGVAQDKDLEPGPYSVRIEVEWFLEMYSIVVPPTGPVQLIELIDDSTPYEPQVVSLVKQYRDEAIHAKGEAQSAASTATSKAAQAVSAAGAADASASAAASSAGSAGSSASTANARASDAETARAAAASAKTSAEAAKTAAESAAITAGTKATEASNSATAAAGSATSAAGSATTATNAANTATTKAGQAASSASAAAQSAADAAGAVAGVATFEGLSGAVTKAQVGLDQVDNTRDVDKPISDPTSVALQNLLAQVGTAFGDLQTEVAEKQDATQVLAAVTAKIADLVGEAPTTLDTIYEIAAALQAEQGATAALTAAIGLRAMADAVVNLAGNQTITGVKNFTGSLQKGGKDVVVTDDARMTNARTPTTHTHTAEQVDGLMTEISNVWSAISAKLDTNKIIPVSSLPGTLTNGTFYFVYTP